MPENQTQSEEFSYDAVAYPSLIIPYTHPERLAVIAKLYGMNPAPAEKCRVLELGCGTGTNINWMAHNLPESEFIGVDLSHVHIAEANKNANELSLENVSFFQQDVMEMTKEDFGNFDYIIAHGLFSWVPDFVREKVLSLYDELLNPEGVGFISYNVYPGCFRRQIVRDLMRFYAPRFADPLEGVEQGINLVGFLTANAPTPVYQEILNHELEGFARRPLHNIYHDDLSEVNQPFYFTEFIAEVEKHNLKFLSETDYLPTQRNHLEKEIAEKLKKISKNLIEYEQYSDFIQCRRFRQTLLHKKDVVLETELDPLKLTDFYISSELKPTSPTIDLNPESYKEFVSKKGDKVNIAHNLTKMVLTSLLTMGSHPVGFNEIVEKANGILQAQGFIYEDLEKEKKVTASLLLQLFSPQGIILHTAKSPILDYVSEKPIADKFARWQSNQENLAVNPYGVGMNIHDNFTRSLLNLLDGTRTREDLIAELSGIIEGDEEISEKETFLAQMPENLEKDLFIMAKMGFLVG